MRYNIGIYASNDWADAKAFADQLRAAEPCTVRIRDGKLFTADQREDFDVVFVRGDFPAVMEAYPDVRNVEEFPAPEPGEVPAVTGRQKRAAKSKDPAPESDAE
jgi:hypothetical protein